MKKTSKKLSLEKETVVSLSNKSKREIRGGCHSGDSTTGYNCIITKITTSPNKPKGFNNN